MKTITKIFLTIVVLIIATPIFAVCKKVPFMTLVLFAGLFAGIRAIWKYNPEEENEDKTIDSDKHQLDKRH